MAGEGFWQGQEVISAWPSRQPALPGSPVAGTEQQRGTAVSTCPPSAAGICYLASRNQTKGGPVLGPAVPSPPLTSAGSGEPQGRPVHRAERSPSQQPAPKHWKTRTCPNQPPDKALASCWDLDTSFATAPQFPAA